MSDGSNQSLGFGAYRAPSTFHGSSVFDTGFNTSSSGHSDLGPIRIAAPAVPLGAPLPARSMSDILGAEKASAVNSALSNPNTRLLEHPLESAPKRQSSGERRLAIPRFQLLQQLPPPEQPGGKGPAISRHAQTWAARVFWPGGEGKASRLRCGPDP